MTSAFILPDITMPAPAAGTESTANVFQAEDSLFDLRPEHESKNCTVCKCIVEYGKPHIHDNNRAQETIKIPVPTKVSERMPAPTRYEEEPTIRPSEPPAAALAKVLKGLEDELAHLKLRQSRYQALYNQHDPSLSKRRRKAVLAKLETLMQVMDAKADQIYSLYDVLEGQKADGHVISEEEVECTLQSIGIDPAASGLRGGAVTVERKKDRPDWDGEGSEESEEDLPWTGFETTGSTGRKGSGN